MLETDFLYAPNVSLTGGGSTEWLPQEYNTIAEDTRVEHHTFKQLGDLIANPLPTHCPDGEWGSTPAIIYL